MIEVVAAQRCIGCDRCIEVCPTRVFDRGPGGIPIVARQQSCQTCFQCEAYCPVDALFVAPRATPEPPGSLLCDEDYLVERELFGGYRRELGWGNGRALGARTAVGPALPD